MDTQQLALPLIELPRLFLEFPHRTLPDDGVSVPFAPLNSPRAARRQGGINQSARTPRRRETLANLHAQEVQS